MKKLFTNLKVALTLLLLCGVCSAWATDVTYTITPDKTTTGNSSTSYVTTAYSFTYNEIGWSFNQWNPSTLQIKTNQSSAGSEFNFKNTSAFAGRIKSVVITFSALTVSDASKLCFVGGTSSISSLSDGTSGTWNSTAKTLTWTPASTDNFTYFAFYQNGKAASGTNYLASTDAITVTYEGSDVPSKTLKSIAVSGTPTETSYETGEGFDPTGLVVTGTYDDKSTADLTVDAEWTIDPATFTSTSQTSVSVTAKVGGVSSSVYTVNGLTVTAAPLNVTYDFRTNLYEHSGVSTSSSGAGNISENESFVEDPTEITFTKAGSTVTRFWDTNNIHELRLYSGAEFEIAAEGYNIIKVEFTGSAVNLTVDGVAVSDNTWTGKKQSVTFVNTSTQSKINSIKVYYEAAAPTAVAPTITPSAEADAYFEAITVTLASETEGASIYYTTNGDAPTTASTLYESPISVNATTTIKAIAVKEGVENSGVVSKTFTFGPTYNSLADLVAAEIASGTIVKVSFENAIITDFYKNTQGMRYGVYLNTQKGDKDIEIYCNAAEHPAEWAANGKLSGTLVGAWQEYNGTWEICPDSWEGLTYTAPSKENPTITATYKTTLGVEEKDEYTVTYSGDGELSITSSNTDVAEATIVGGKVLIETKSAGTTTITISATETEGYNAVNEEYTLKVTGPAALPFAYNGGKSGLSNGMTQTGLDSDYSSLPKLKFDDTGDELVIWFAEQAGYVSYDIKGNSFAGGTFQVMESADGEEYTVVSTHTGLGAVTTIGNALNSDSRYVKFVYTSKSTGNVALGNICINKPASITAAGWATAYVPFTATVSENATAYYVTGTNGSALTKVKANVIPAGEGVLLKSNDGGAAIVTFTASAEDADAAAEGNMMKGSLTETTFAEQAGVTYYILTVDNNDNLGFYWDPETSDGGKTATCPAGKAVLAVSTTGGNAKMFFYLDDDATGINNVEMSKMTKGIRYNLNGQAVGNDFKGVVIVNGKKFVK